MEEELTQIQYRQQFYQDSKQAVLTIIMLLACVIGLLGWFVYIQLNKVPEPRYFDQTRFGQLRQPLDLEKPHLSQNVVLNWVTELVMRAYSFNFTNMQRTLISLKPNFTEKGFHAYLDALAYTGRREWVLQDRLIAVAEPSEAPVILREGILDGQYVWKIKIPLKIRYLGIQHSKQNEIRIDLLVVRVPVSKEAEYGIKIQDLQTRYLSRYIDQNQQNRKR